MLSSLKKIILVFSIIVLTLSCNKDPQDVKLQKQWVATHVDSSNGNEIESTIFFGHDGTITFQRNLKNWTGNWYTNKGELNVSFENSSINGLFDYNTTSNRGHSNSSGFPVGNGLPYDQLELEPIEIDDSLLVNQFKGTYNSLY